MNYILGAIIIVLLGTVTFLVGERNGEPLREPVSTSTESESVVAREVPGETAPTNTPTPTPTPPPTTSGRTLDMSGGGLTKVPGSVFEQSDLETLNVSNNNLSGSLQAEVRFLVNLRTLDLSDNNFTGVPAEVGQLSKLEVLDLSNNPLSGLPYEIGNLKNLKVLDLRGTNYAPQDLEVIRKGLPNSVDIKVD